MFSALQKVVMILEVFGLKNRNVRLGNLKMKRYLFCLLFFAAGVQAENYSHVDLINRLGSIDSRENGDFLMVQNFSDAGTCPKSGGLVIARIRSGTSGDRSFSMALAAKLSEKKVKISIDDSKRTPEGDCYLNSLEVSD